MNAEQVIKEIINISKTRGSCDFDEIIRLVSKISLTLRELDKWLFQQSFNKHGMPICEIVKIEDVRNKIKELSDGK